SRPAVLRLTASTIFSDSDVAVDLGGGATGSTKGSILAAVGILTGPACTSGHGLTSGGYNVATGTTCGLTPATHQQGFDPALNPLANSGGGALPFLPKAFSPAVDHSPTGTPSLCVTGSIDERHVARPAGSACDVGAVEGHT